MHGQHPLGFCYHLLLYDFHDSHVRTSLPSSIRVIKTLTSFKGRERGGLKLSMYIVLLFSEDVLSSAARFCVLLTASLCLPFSHFVYCHLSLTVNFSISLS